MEIYVYLFIHVYIHIYIYIYVHILGSDDCLLGRGLLIFHGSPSMVITMTPCVRCRRRNGFGWHGHDHVLGMVIIIAWGLYAWLRPCAWYGDDHHLGVVLMVMTMGLAW